MGVVTEAYLVGTHNRLDHLSEEFPQEAPIAVHLHLEEVWAHHQQVEALVKMGVAIHGTLLVQEVGRGRLQALFIQDRL